MRYLTTTLLAAALLVGASTATAADFTYQPPGDLEETGKDGRVDDHVYVPNMRYPIENSPSYANSQVWGHGGYQGPGGGQCDDANYSYPWWDNFCETRSWDVALCPSGNGHQGQDIRPATCEDAKHWAVAAEDGVITSIGTYSMYLKADNGTRHRYLHMQRASYTVGEGDRVAKGDRLGKVSNEFGGTPTTIHLHYDLYQNVSGVGNTYVPTYMSLVESYQRLIGEPAEPCGTLGASGGTIDDAGSCFTLHGPPSSWRYVADAGNGGQLHWTYAWDDPDPGNWAEWDIITSEAGTYRVEVFLVSEYAQAQRGLYRVQHNGADEEVRLDMSQGDGWRSLGEFDFAAGGDQRVAVYDNTGESLDQQRKIIADAIRLTRVEDESSDDVGSTEDAGTGDTGLTEDTGSSADTGGEMDTDSSDHDDSGMDASGDDSGEETNGQHVTTSSSCTTAGESPVDFGALLLLFGIVVFRVGRRR
ncbi:MAG: peptidoglycan DD-metalloendopeptidase family protein [Myxococcota bacterium]